DGILVAPGFGQRGIEGKLNAIRYARMNHVPFFGICLGMQCAVVEFARNVLDLPEASSEEFIPETEHPVIHLMPDQINIENMGGTMRLGSWKCHLEPSSKAFESYGQEIIHERHRHRFEFNNAYLEDFRSHGFIPSGINKEKNLIEIMELTDHPWFIGVQFHPELKSRVERPHPLFSSFILAAIDHKNKNNNLEENLTEPYDAQTEVG